MASGFSPSTPTLAISITPTIGHRPPLGPPVVPSGTATFVASNTRDITINAATPLDGMTLNQDAGAFTFTNHATLTFGGSGIVVGSGASATITNNNFLSFNVKVRPARQPSPASTSAIWNFTIRRRREPPSSPIRARASNLTRRAPRPTRQSPITAPLSSWTQVPQTKPSSRRMGSSLSRSNRAAAPPVSNWTAAASIFPSSPRGERRSVRSKAAAMCS